MSRREVPKLNRDNFSAWQSIMKLHLGGIGDHAQDCITTEHVESTPPTADDLKKMKEYNQAMMEISFSLNYAKFDDIKGLDSAKRMWDALKKIYEGDKKVQRAKSKS